MKKILIDHIEKQIMSGRSLGSLSEDYDLLGSGVLDSLGVMSLVFFIEETFGVEVPPQDVTIENFASVATIDAYLKRRQA